MHTDTLLRAVSLLPVLSVLPGCSRFASTSFAVHLSSMLTKGFSPHLHAPNSNPVPTYEPQLKCYDAFISSCLTHPEITWAQVSPSYQILTWPSWAFHLLNDFSFVLRKGRPVLPRLIRKEFTKQLRLLEYTGYIPVNGTCEWTVLECTQKLDFYFSVTAFAYLTLTWEK